MDPTRLAKVMTIDDCALEICLGEIDRMIKDKNHGLFGPDSAFWYVNRESICFLGAGCAMLLQLAHPYVSQAIADHSSVRQDPLGRYYRTMPPVFAMVFGTRDQAFSEARKIHHIHTQIAGSLPERVGIYPVGWPYQANEARASLWVHATLWYTARKCYELVLPSLSLEAAEQYNSDCQRFAGLFGIPRALHPTDASAFQAYFDDMLASDFLAVSPAGRETRGYFFDRKQHAIARFMPEWYVAITASLLPERFRNAFGLVFGDRERAMAQRVIDRIRVIYPRLPHRIRFVGPYQEAISRVAGRTRPSPMTRAVNRIWLGRSEIGA